MKNIMCLIIFTFLTNMPNQISLPMKEIEEILQLIKEIDELQNKTSIQRSKL
jgi:hypothetical protein